MLSKKCSNHFVFELLCSSLNLVYFRVLLRCLSYVTFQDHYDFGLRAVKSVLLMAGQQRRRVG